MKTLILAGVGVSIVVAYALTPVTPPEHTTTQQAKLCDGVALYLCEQTIQPEAITLPVLPEPTASSSIDLGHVTPVNNQNPQQASGGVQ